ncbi:MAG: MaoC/PaaZ C-terminal domain-containing protein [Gammaproteobacteria bacterium]
MPLPVSLVGAVSGPFHYTADARWLMAYAAALGERAPCYFDTRQPLAHHPLFPVCLEWDAIVALRESTEAGAMSAAEKASAVHAEHDLHLLRPIRAGERLQVTATAIALEARRPGAYLLKRIDTRDAAGELVTRTYQGTLYRGVSIDGAPCTLEAAPAWPAAADQAPDGPGHAIEVPAGLAHVYTECARIWNPIHTDLAHALAAGLPDIILHGTATLALALSTVVATRLGGAPARVTRLGCRMSGMVRLPSTLTLHAAPSGDEALAFAVRDALGAPVLGRGFVVCAPS